MKRLKKLPAVAVLLLSMTLFTGCGTYRYSTSGFQTSYDNPPWAPSYYDGARYYYFPDIECYYDIYAREFVYLYNAHWVYSPTFPSIYSGFDLNDCFVVVVNSNIYQPWMHHQYYVSHFPRYYYRDYYDHSNIPYVRGFNENNRSAIYWSENERNRARNWDDVNLRNGRRFSYSKEDRQHQINANNQTGYRQSPDYKYGNENSRNNPGQRGNSGNAPVNRQTQNDRNQVTQPVGPDNTNLQKPANIEEKRRPDATNYYGRPIGQPVKARKQMRIQNPAGTTDRSGNRTGNQRNRSEDAKDQNKRDRR